LTWRNFAEITKVQKIETLAVVEAVKVRNVLRAQRDGTVTKIDASSLIRGR